MNSYQRRTKKQLIEELETVNRIHQQALTDFEALKTQFADQARKREELETRCQELDHAYRSEKRRHDADAVPTKGLPAENVQDQNNIAEDGYFKEIVPQIFDAVIEASGRRQILLTTDCRIAFLTNAAARDIGVAEPKSMTGRNFFEFLNPEHAEKFADKAKSALTKQKSKHCKVSFHSYTKGSQAWEIKIKRTMFRDNPALLLTLKK